MKRIGRFIKALWRYIRYGKRVSFDEYVTRLNSCRYCLHTDTEKWTCKKCGCYIIKKCKMSTEECPAGRWLV